MFSFEYPKDFEISVPPVPSPIEEWFFTDVLLSLGSSVTFPVMCLLSHTGVAGAIRYQCFPDRTEGSVLSVAFPLLFLLVIRALVLPLLFVLK